MTELKKCPIPGCGGEAWDFNMGICCKKCYFPGTGDDEHACTEEQWRELPRIVVDLEDILALAAAREEKLIHLNNALKKMGDRDYLDTYWKDKFAELAAIFLEKNNFGE